MSELSYDSAARDAEVILGRASAWLGEGDDDEVRAIVRDVAERRAVPLDAPEDYEGEYVSERLFLLDRIQSWARLLNLRGDAPGRALLQDMTDFLASMDQHCCQSVAPDVRFTRARGWIVLADEGEVPDVALVRECLRSLIDPGEGHAVPDRERPRHACIRFVETMLPEEDGRQRSRYDFDYVTDCEFPDLSILYGAVEGLYLTSESSMDDSHLREESISAAQVLRLSAALDLDPTRLGIAEVYEDVPHP